MTAVYLASPYSHPDPEVRLARFNSVMTAGAWLLQRRIWYFSPIQHAHIQAIRFKLPTDADFWWDYNRTMIEAHRAVIMLCIDGWKESKGMMQEFEYAVMNDLPVQWMKEEDGGWSLTNTVPETWIIPVRVQLQCP